MAEQEDSMGFSGSVDSFYERPAVELETIPVGSGVAVGIEQVFKPELGIGGAYGTWGESYDNLALTELVEHRLGGRLSAEEHLNLAALGFVNRYHVSDLSDEQHVELEISVGAKLLRKAAQACGWKPEEVEGVLIGTSGPVTLDYTERIAAAAGIPESAVKVSVHKACDSSVGALNLALNPELEANHQLDTNFAQELLGKKILVGGIEGLSRLIERSLDYNALQLFGNGAGVIGLIPGKTIRFLVGKAHEVFDEDGVLEMEMHYPHSRQPEPGQSYVEATHSGANHYRVAGLMHEPENGRSVAMAGPMGMVKLFVRSGVEVVRDVYRSYQSLMEEIGSPEKSLAAAVVHHANYKINKLKEKHLTKEGIRIPLPWVLSEFGNVSAASNMIAFLRQLPEMNLGDHILIDGFGAGTYYDVLAVSLGDQPA